jgi:hypothetical protein
LIFFSLCIEKSVKMSSHGKKSKKKKDPILAASGQTDAERRSLRIAQRGLQKEIASDLGDNMENPELGGGYTAAMKSFQVPIFFSSFVF